MKKMKKSKHFNELEWDGKKYYEGTPSDIRKIVARLKIEGAVRKNGRYPMREGQLYQLEIVDPKGYNIWSPGIQLKEKPAERSSVWDLKNLDTLRTSRPAVFRSLYYEARNSIREWHICNAVHTVMYGEAEDIAYEVWRCFHAYDDDTSVIDAKNNLRYAIAIMAVCIAGINNDKKRMYKGVRKVVKYNKKYFLTPIIEGNANEYVRKCMEERWYES